MNTDTGDLRPLEPDERLPRVEDVRGRLAADPDVPIPDEVAVPADYLPLTPAQRLALAFGSSRGPDRKAARTPPKSDRQRRYERAEARKARKRS